MMRLAKAEERFMNALDALLEAQGVSPRQAHEIRENLRPPATTFPPERNKWLSRLEADPTLLLFRGASWGALLTTALLASYWRIHLSSSDVAWALGIAVGIAVGVELMTTVHALANRNLLWLLLAFNPLTFAAVIASIPFLGLWKVTEVFGAPSSVGADNWRSVVVVNVILVLTGTVLFAWSV